MVGKFGREIVGRINFFQAFDHRKFSKLVDQSGDYYLLLLIRMVLVWQIMDDSPNLPNFPAILYIFSIIHSERNISCIYYW